MRQPEIVFGIKIHFDKNKIQDELVLQFFLACNLYFNINN